MKPVAAHPCRFVSVLLPAVLAAFVTPLFAQDAPVATALLGRWNAYPGAYSEATTDGNYIYGGNFARNVGDQPARIFVVDITDPTNPVLANEVFIPSPNNDKSPEDVMLAPNGLLFVGMETTGADAVAIFDARNPPALPLLATVRLPAYQTVHRAHNVQYHEGFLYYCDSSTPKVAIVDLTTFDPDNPPPSPITTEKWVMTGVGTSFVHEILPITLPPPYGKVLYCAGWNSGVLAYDITNVATTMPTLLGSAPGTSTHSMWPTSDGKFVVSGEERSNGGIKVWEVTADTPTSWSFALRDSLVLPDDAFSVHNQAVVGNRLYNAWYQAGLQVHDIDPVTGLLTFVASYDTSPFANSGTFAGNWSVFPFNGEDKIVLSDLEEGYFVVKLQQPLFTISYPNGRPATIDPQTGAEVRVTVTPISSQPDPNGATLYYQIDGGAVQSIAMAADGSDFVANFGAQPCGSDISYWVEITELGTSEVVLDPFDAPTHVHHAPVVDSIVTSVNYDFEISTGWAVSGSVTGGAWQAGVPAGGGARGDPPTDYDGSGQCYLTQNVAGDSDVDGGSTILTSPVFSAAGLSEPVIGYARWYNNSAGSNPASDTFLVEISNNGGSSWSTLETVGPAGVEVVGGWFEKSFHVDDVIPATANMRLRFTASDLGAGSIVEAAIDAVTVKDYVCDALLGSCCLGLNSCTENVVEGQCGGVFRLGVNCTTPCDCVSNAECDDGLFCNGAETCTGGDCVSGSDPCGIGQFCNEATDTCESIPGPPVVSAVGSRYLAVTPAAGPDPVALRLTAPTEPCLVRYVQGNGELGVGHDYRTPAAWGTVFANGAEMFPQTAYNLEAETPGGLLSPAAGGTLWKWGDTDGGGLVNLDDILAVIRGFQGDFSQNTLQALDLTGCNPEGVINLDDILGVLAAFGNQPLSCADPCP